MQEQPSKHLKYPSDHWGALAQNPAMEIGASGDGWISVIRETWLRNGDTEQSFYEAFPEYAPRLGISPRPQSQ
jgi:hypothetical protein